MSRKPSPRPNGRPRGTPQSPEVRARISAAKKGWQPSCATRIRMSEGQKRRHARMREAADAGT